ncbi:MAG: hypothetical protein P8J32_06745 [bacterium]|nr:hypothetical protein [bacterium]
MNIFALKGFRVKVTERTKNAGWKTDRKLVTAYLEVEKEYTVERTEVDRSSSIVVLQEFPDVKFNTVNFEDVSTQSEEDDAKHPYAAKLKQE